MVYEYLEVADLCHEPVNKITFSSMPPVWAVAPAVFCTTVLTDGPSEELDTGLFPSLVLVPPPNQRMYDTITNQHNMV